MQKPLVTIVVLTYYKFDGIKQNLESIAKQKYPNIEVIIQDDGSANFDRDYLENLCKTTLGDFKWLVHQNEKNMGTVRSFNTAIELANGEFVFPLSQDDRFYDENVVEKIVEFFQKNPDCMTCTSNRVGEKSGRVYPTEVDAKLLASWDRKELWNRTLYENFISGATIYYRVDFMKARGGFDTDSLLVEDYPFVLAMILEDKRIGFLDETTIIYGEDGVSNGSTPSPKMLADRMVMYEKYIVPNMDKIESKWMKRYVKYQYGDIRHRQDLPKRILHNLWSWKVVLRLLYGMHVKKLNYEERYQLWKK